MTRQKRNRDRYWCHTCRLIGYRILAQAQDKVKQYPKNKEVVECPEGFGWHFR